MDKILYFYILLRLSLVTARKMNITQRNERALQK